MNLRQGRRTRGPGEEDEDEMWRFKENFAKITRIKKDIYSNLPIIVDVRNKNLQQDPFDYEMEHKKRQIWSVQDIKIFFSVLSESPKYIWVATTRLPHKTSKEILYFAQAFAGLMKFENYQLEVNQVKQQLKHQRDKIPNAISDIIDTYLKPLYSHLKCKTPENAFNWLNFNKNGCSSATFYDQMRFNIQELFEVFGKHRLPKKQIQTLSKSKN